VSTRQEVVQAPPRHAYGWQLMVAGLQARSPSHREVVSTDPEQELNPHAAPAGQDVHSPIALHFPVSPQVVLAVAMQIW
jgi:hypothetical protein